jgi:hypothetical protein
VEPGWQALRREHRLGGHRRGYRRLTGTNSPTATLPVSRPDMAVTPLFDNSRVRAVRATLQPGFHEDAGTTHDYDQVVVTLVRVTSHSP